MNELDLFTSALALSDAAERGAYLDRACAGNPDLRRRLDELLSAHGRDGNPLDSESVGVTATGEPVSAGATATFGPDSPAHTADFPGKDERAGAVIGGKYTLVEAVGEGGMGAVWRAKQTEPVKRFVAVKLIKAGMDSKQVLARFDAERQALAIMDHPNIAHVLDGGLHESRPYFVMELVKGVPITEFCDARKLTPRERLELFVPVCQAIQHAHQKGVIHRDIKPSNVLIALYDDKPVVKVIDFGVAKATGTALTEHTIDTGFGGVVGTPQYMSPEQATFNNLDIDTRSDVYALGVLLYELLTGSTPFSKNELEKRGLLEILRVVREVEPPRPSTKLSTADALPTLSANRGTEPKTLTGLLRNELDWIVMKSLEKDRARRYETANGFAADVLRYLRGDAVQAHPPNTSYRLRKFARRNRGPLVATALVLLVLVAGIVGTAWQAVRATRNEATAVSASELAGERLLEVTRERDRATTAEVKTREEAAVARACLDYLRSDLFEQANPWAGDNPEKVRDKDVKLISVVDRAARGVGARFPDQPLVEAAVRQMIGATYLGLAEFGPAQEQLEQAVAIRRRVLGDDAPETLSVTEDLAIVCRELGSYPYAIELYGRMIEVYRRTPGGDDRKVIWATHNLGEVYLRQGRDQEGEELLNVALAAWRRRGAEGERPSLYVLAVLLDRYSDRGEHDRVAVMLPDALERSRRLLGPDHPITIRLTFCACELSAHRGRLKEAEEQYLALLRTSRRTFGDDHPVTKKIEGYLGGVYVRLGQPREAESLWRRKLASDRRVLGNDHPFTLRSIEVISQLLTDEGKHGEAEPLLRECLAIREKKEPDAWTTFETSSLLGGSLLEQRKHAAAEPLLLKGYEGLKQREKTIPPQGSTRIPETLDRLIELYAATDKPDEAKKWRAERAKYPNVAPMPRERK